MSREITLALVFFIAALQLPAPGADRIEVISACTSRIRDVEPHLYHIIFRNNGPAPLKIKYLIVPNKDGTTTRSVGAEDPDVLWWRAAPLSVAPGAHGEVRVRLSRPEVELTAVRIQSEDGRHVSTELSNVAPAIVVRSVKYSAQDEGLSVYWVSRGEKREEIDEIALNGRVLPSNIYPDGRVAEPFETRCLFLPLKETPPVGSHQLLQLRAKSGASATVMFRVNPPFFWGVEQSREALFAKYRVCTDRSNLDEFQSSYAGMWPAVCSVGTCLTHYPDTPRANAWQALRVQREVWQKHPRALTAVHLCRDQLEDGLVLFGQMADQVFLNPYAHPIAEHLVRDWEQPKQIMDFAREQARTGALVGVIPFNRLEDDRALPRTLLAIASGAAGVLYRLPSSSGPDFERLRAGLEAQLLPLKASLPVWDAAELLKTVETDNPSVGAWLVQMGPRRMAVIAFDSVKRSKPGQLKLGFELPGGLLANRILDVEGAELQSLAAPARGITFTLPHFKDATVIFLELAKPNGVEHAF